MDLTGLPPVLWINLDRSARRRHYMNNLMNTHRLNHQRIPAIDGADQDSLSGICIANAELSDAENACTCSHLKAIKYFLDNMPDDEVIIFEDDVSFEFLPDIPFSWRALRSIIPADYDVIQLAISTDYSEVSPDLVKTDPTSDYYSATAYLINKAAAAKLVTAYYMGGKVDLSDKSYATADAMIISVGNVYSIPIFTYLTVDSTIHPDHLGLHWYSKQKQKRMWMNYTTMQ